MPGIRKWVKLWVTECLEGGIRYQLEPNERSVWYDLLLFAALRNPAGHICDRDGRPFPHQFIAGRLNISVDLLELTLKKCIKEGRITEDGGGIHITNWARYQSEYERQKPFREKKKQDEIDPDKYIKGKYGHMVQRKSEKSSKYPFGAGSAGIRKEGEKWKTQKSG